MYPSLIRSSFAGIFALSAAVHAAVTLPSVFSDHMVLQRDRPIHVWGKAKPGETVAVTFQGESRSVVAETTGLWSLYLRPSPAGGPYELRVAGENTLTFRDVLMGDVWVASGQSNMEWPLSAADNAATEMPAANQPRIRFFAVKRTTANYPLDDAQAGPWVACTPETAPGSSAVAYFFARDLQKQYDVPIGIIESYWGGTPADAWTSLRAISADAGLMPVFADWARMTDDSAVAIPERQKELKQWSQDVERAKAAGKVPPFRPWRNNDNGEWEPAALYNAMIAPLTPFAVRGVIWYQGESNASRERAPLYSRLFSTMILDWRRAWGQPDMPFLFVQLARYQGGDFWPVLREQQLKTLALANTGMAVTIDGPVDLHPTNKQDVGARLALAARAVAYGDRVEYSGPVFRQATPEGETMRVWFDHTGTGLVAKGDDLTGFEVAGIDRKFVAATARIDGATLVVSAPGVRQPRYVRYAWADVPSANLFNKEGLPASPFRSAE